MEFPFPLSLVPGEDLQIKCFACGVVCAVSVSDVQRPFDGSRSNSDKKKPPAVPPRKKGSGRFL